MRKCVLFVLILFPFLLTAQYEVSLFVIQSPELRFTQLKSDTTIVKGSTVKLDPFLIITGGSGKYRYSWSPGSSLNDPAILNPTAMPVDTTRYVLTVTDENGCSFSANYIVNVKSQATHSEFIRERGNLFAEIIPNPNTGCFKVHVSGVPSGKMKMEVLCSSGKVIDKITVSRFSGNHTELFQRNLSEGVYFLKTESGGLSETIQFIVY